VPNLITKLTSLIAFVLTSLNTLAQPPSPVIAGNTIVCHGQNTTLTASVTPADPTLTYRWHDNLVGGNLLFSGNPYTTNSIIANTTIYAESVDAFGTPSVLRTAILIVVISNSDVPTAAANPASLCPGGTVTLTASSVNGSSTFNWYNDQLGGTLLFTGNPYTTSLTGTTIFYLQSEDGSGCKSPRTAITVPVLPNMDAPTASAAPATICPGESVTITGTSLNGSTIFNWFNTPIGGLLLQTGNPFIATPTTTTNYYVETENTNGCQSARTPILVTVLPNLDVPIASASPATVCPNVPVTLNATSINGSTIFHWYSQQSGGAPLYTGATYTTSVPTSTTFYVESENSNGCRSIRTPVAVVVTPNLDVPTGTPNPTTVCPGDNVTMTGTSLNGSSIFNWYDDINAGTLLYTGNPYVTTVSATTIFYLETEDPNGCTSFRTPVLVSTLPNLDLPTATANPGTICPGESVSMMASSINGSTIFHWYDSISTGNLLYSGNPYVDTYNANSTVFVETENTNGCRSLRTPVNVLVLPNLDVPIGAATPAAICPGENVQLAASSINGSTIFNWYDAPVSGNLLFTGQTVNTTVSATTTYYLESENAVGCLSVRTPVTVVVTPSADIPLATSNPAVICPSVTVTLTGTSITGATVFNWYDTIQGGTVLFTGQNYSPLVATTSTFYVETEDASGCKSLRTPVIVTVISNLDSPGATASPATVCNGQSTLLTGYSTVGASIFNWYDSPSGGTLLHQGVNFSPLLSGTTTYYLATENSNGCQSIRTPITIQTITNNDVPNPTAVQTLLCNPGNIVINGASTNGSQNFKWFDSSVGGNLLATTQNYTAVVTSASDYFLETEDANGCISSRTQISISIQPNNDVPSLAQNPNPLCSGQVISMDAISINASPSFSWFDAQTGGNLLGSGTNYSETISTSKVVYLESGDTNGCISSRTALNIVVDTNNDSPIITAFRDTVCTGNVATLSGATSNGSTVFHWYDNALNGNLLFTGNIYYPQVSGNVVFYLETENVTGCKSSRASYQIYTSPSPSVSLVSQDTSFCDGSSLTIVANSTDPNASFTWYDAPISGNIIYTGNPVITGSLDSNLIVFVEAKNIYGCPSSRQPITLTVKPIDSLIGPEVFCENPARDKILFSWSASPMATDYTVSLDGGSSWTSTNTNNFWQVKGLLSEEEVEFMVRVVSQGEAICVDTSKATSQVIQCRAEYFHDDKLEIPYNSFSPNNDKVNDFWNIGPDVPLYPDNEVTIFNRLGELVFQTQGYDNLKNYFDGDNLSDGSYYYIVNIPSIDFKQTGYLMITR
jgi:gliding motility-associated-like protein